MFLVAAILLASPHVQAQTYDAAWWGNLTAEERTKFYSGVIDCYIVEAHGKTYSDGPIESVVQAISTYYQRHPEASRRSVLDVTLEVSTSDTSPHLAGERHRDPGAEYWDEPHGYFDGEYWRQSVDPERQAFVRGYLACRAKYLHSTTDVSIAVIVSKISKWYGVKDDDPSEIDDRHANDKIGDLLDRIVNEKHRR